MLTHICFKNQLVPSPIITTIVAPKLFHVLFEYFKAPLNYFQMRKKYSMDNKKFVEDKLKKKTDHLISYFYTQILLGPCMNNLSQRSQNYLPTDCLSLHNPDNSSQAPQNSGSICMEHSKFSMASFVKSSAFKTIPYL